MSPRSMWTQILRMEIEVHKHLAEVAATAPSKFFHFYAAADGGEGEHVPFHASRIAGPPHAMTCGRPQNQKLIIGFQV